MSTQTKQPLREQIDELLGAGSSNPLKDFFQDAAEMQLPSPPPESNYQHYVVETMPGGRREIHRLTQYGERELFSQAARPTFRFRWKCEKLLKQAENVLAVESGSQHFEQQATLLWADIATLSQHLGLSSESDEIITALLVTCSQFVKRITPRPTVEALVEVFRLVSTHVTLPLATVDKALDVLEESGVDLNHPLTFGKANG